MLGSGEAILNTPFRFIAKKAIKRLSESVYKQKYREIKATMPLNKWWFKMAANIYWTRYGKKFGITKKEMQTLESKHSKKCTFYTLRFGCSFAAVNTIKPQLL